MTWILAGYAFTAAAFTVWLILTGLHFHKRRERDEARREYRWHMSPMILGELDPVIRAEDR